MRHTDEAGYGSGDRQGCLRGTRADVLLQLERWLKDEQDHRIFWLNGLAGTGKSTIAQTFAETCFADGKLGASFFCSRDSEDRSNLKAIFPTLALQLAYRYLLFREKLLRVLRANPGVGRESLCSQMERIIVGPLKAVRIRTLIIIDALDECKDEEPASAILSVLARYVDEIPNAKFFITGRPEPRIRSGFRLKPLRPITEVLRLHDVKRSSVDSDIRLFLRTRLSDIAKARSDCDFTRDWPSPSDINTLCEKAAGFFVYASTVIKLDALNGSPWTLSYWKNTVAVGSTDSDILILDAITGSWAAVLPGHTGGVKSLVFSSDGTLLVSGSDDKTVKLWDVQTGGVVRTFHGHTKMIWSVSISANHTTVASGSDDKTLRLWDIHMGVSLDCRVTGKGVLCQVLPHKYSVPHIHMWWNCSAVGH